MIYGSVPLCNDDKRYDCGKDLSYCYFPRDKQKRKRTPSLDYVIYFEYIQLFVYAHPASFQIQTGGCVIRVYDWEVLRRFHDY